MFRATVLSSKPVTKGSKFFYVQDLPSFTSKVVSRGERGRSEPGLKVLQIASANDPLTAALLHGCI